jgi:hypothetical protein
VTADPSPGPRISFGLIVLNGEPFTRYTLRSLYPWAHQLIVVEGACAAARAVATADGHSRDETLEVLRRFQAEEDPQKKLTIVTAEDEGHPDGFWPGEKDEMSGAYARRATGDYLWQVDADEFYKPEDMSRILAMLGGRPKVTEVSFLVRTFFAAPQFLVDGWYLRDGANSFRRLFAWKPAYRYATHRPPTVVDEHGRDLASLNPVSAGAMARQGIFLYHCEQLLPKQVLEKSSYYSHRGIRGVENTTSWASDCYLALRRPYRVHMLYEYPSWLEPHTRGVPPEMTRMMEAVRGGEHAGISLRPTDDIDALLKSRTYAAGRALLKALYPFWHAYREGRRRLGRLRRRLVR